MTIIEPIAPPAIAVALLDLTECVCTELATTGGGPMCWCGLYPGLTVSWDYCGECEGDKCGMAYIRLAGVTPYDLFPFPAVDDRCVKPLAWGIEIGALRCFPTPADGSLVDPNTMAEVAMIQVLDAQAVWRAIKCCGIDLAVEAWRPLGPLGGCVGGAWSAFAALD